MTLSTTWRKRSGARIDHYFGVHQRPAAEVGNSACATHPGHGAGGGGGAGGVGAGPGGAVGDGNGAPASVKVARAAGAG